MNAVIIFDVTKGEELNVVQSMRKLGYATTWEFSGSKYKLPHNVVWRPDTEIEQAKADLNTVIEQRNLFRVSNTVKLHKCIILNSSPWGGITGDGT